jgi:hypothetical protein
MIFDYKKMCIRPIRYDSRSIKEDEQVHGINYGRGEQP